ncbi:TatD family hydrolase [Corynebacterium pseudopelargi]|uniref:Putative deoxyribonuclease YcfH n=1 Tax=Corynebacterium pseudopelargi TaxID=2080757 RepID=A0A3G6IVJ1_9CORY|nr:TatD family hydrolase [Corynebacterium pseudopelargi]AZA09656.1 putative deoxyribonuclease YcfH [Corynebacterium pseudopelargi]
MGKKKPRPAPVPADHPGGMVDAHTHLSSAKDSVERLVQRAKLAGVERICTVGDGVEEAAQALSIAQTQPDVVAACAIHPTKAQQLDQQARARLEAMAADPACVAIGETGLDTYWIQHDPERTADLATQISALEWHIDLAIKHNKALMIHNREADQPLLDVLAASPKPVQTILHCFSSPVDVAEEALARGYVLSFAGNATFKRNDFLREAARIAPVEQILVETDAPYMTPEPYRGSPNEPSLIGHTYLALAAARGEDPAEFAAAVSKNFARVYGL